MKMKTKKGFVRAKNWAINYQVFMELSVKNKRFIPRLMEIREIFDLPKLEVFKYDTVVLGEHPTDKEWHKFSILRRQIDDWRNEFLEKCRASGVQAMLFELIDLNLTDAGLGQEWKFPLIDFLLTGYITPPMGNLVIKPNAKTKTVSLEVNSNTTMEDIKILWPTIQKAIADVSDGKPKKRYLRKNFNEQLNLLSKDQVIRAEDPKIKGADIIGRMTPELSDREESTPTREEEERAATNLRQIRSRFKAK